jgi:CarD family transcriptional regulator
MHSFEVGSPIVHPIHGAGILKKIDQRQVRGRLLSYYVIDFPYSDLGQVMVPVEMADRVGLRDVIENETIDNIFDSLAIGLSEDEEEESKSFHQRYREYLEKIQSGDLEQVAYVYRLLFRRSMVKPLGTKDKALFETARQLLISEIVFVKDVVDSEAKTMLDEAMEDMIF